MTAPLADLARRYRFNENVLGMVTDGFGAEDWGFRPGAAGGNTPHWIVGHLAASRRHLRRTLGEAVEEAPWEAHFGMKSRPTGTAGYPDPAALIEDFVTSGEAVAARLAALTPAEAATEFGGAFPDGGKTLEGAAHFLHFHESYHLGQLGLTRRMRGHPGFA